MDVNLPDPDSIRAALPAAVQRLVVAFSGGVDSTVLLQLASLSGLPVKAIHIHHGLHPSADDWAGHCRQFCDARRIPLDVVEVEVERSGGGLEAAAREARYDALAAALSTGDCLLTAHHADDQAETLLLRMLRGTGPDGLGGIAACRAFGPGWLHRPLLDYTRADIMAYAEQEALSWIEDPGNQTLAQDRNYLRHQVMPVMRGRWPKASATMARLADLAREQRQVLDQLLDEKLQSACADGIGPLRFDALSAAAEPLQAALLRAWLTSAGVRPPGRERLKAGLAGLLTARADRTPRLEWPDAQIVRHGDWLYRLPVVLPKPPAAITWQPGSSASAPWFGALGFVAGKGTGFACPAELADETLQLRSVQRGERVKLAGRPTKAISEYAREAGILPWWRALLPVVESGSGEVLAVGGLGLTETGLARLSADSWGLCWQLDAGRLWCDLRYLRHPGRAES